MALIALTTFLLALFSLARGSAAEFEARFLVAVNATWNGPGG